MKKFYAPGRVNLIGEHIDYNGGNVLPVGINIGTYGQVKLRDDRKITLFSHNFSNMDPYVINLNEPLIKEDNWCDYVKGVIEALKNRGYQITQGFDLEITGNIPSESGLSSSASLEVLVTYIIATLENLNISRTEISLISQEAENNFVGVNCGIMDQFIIANAKKNQALNLNTNTLAYELIECDFKEYQLVIFNSKKQRGLVNSEYNSRRLQCQAGLEIIKKFYDVSEICQISMDQLLKIQAEFPAETFKRVHHAVSEQHRVDQAVLALKAGDIVSFGELMNQSHISLRDDFAVSCQELDLLVELSLQYGAVGARMTGAGFGGCTIALIEKAQAQEVCQLIKAQYDQATGYDAEFYLVSVEDGVHEQQ